jgi:hypothetical protein
MFKETIRKDILDGSLMKMKRYGKCTKFVYCSKLLCSCHGMFSKKGNSIGKCGF